RASRRPSRDDRGAPGRPRPQVPAGRGLGVEAIMFDPFRPGLLEGKTTIITGGGTGLGRSMALRMAGLGARVAVLGRRPEPLQDVADRVRAAGGRAAATPCDVRDPEAVEAALSRVEDELGALNQLVNNAAGN